MSFLFIYKVRPNMREALHVLLHDLVIKGRSGKYSQADPALHPWMADSKQLLSDLYSISGLVKADDILPTEHMQEYPAQFAQKGQMLRIDSDSRGGSTRQVKP